MTKANNQHNCCINPGDGAMTMANYCQDDQPQDGISKHEFMQPSKGGMNCSRCGMAEAFYHIPSTAWDEFIKGAEQGTLDSNAGRVRPLEDVVADLPVPDAAKLSDERKTEIEIDDADGAYGYNRTHLIRAVASKATEHAWRVFMAGIPAENLTADTQYAVAWGRHSRDAEVAGLQEQLAAQTRAAVWEAKNVGQLEEKLDTARNEWATAEHECSKTYEVLQKTQVSRDQIKQERDDALVQVRALVEAMKTAIWHIENRQPHYAIKPLRAAIVQHGEEG